MIQVRGVSKAFRPAKSPPVQALLDVSLDVEPEQFVTIVGPSGCGKTTLLRALAGLEPAVAGEIWLGGRPPRPGPNMGFVFQSFRLLPWRTIRANVGFTVEVAGMDARARAERTDYYLELVGLKRFADSYPSELSGGMKQRAALARALVADPHYLLMDEPFASLDAQTREFMQLELMKIWYGRKSTAIFVTHSVDEAILLSDRIVLLRPRPGQVAEIIDVGLPHPRVDVRRARVAGVRRTSALSLGSHQGDGGRRSAIRLLRPRRDGQRRLSASSSSSVRGQSAFSNRDRLRSASSVPPVWHRAQ